MLCNEIVEFMNNDLNTRNFSVWYDNYLVKTFKDAHGNSILRIFITKNGSYKVCYWFDYDRVWWEGQNDTDLALIKKMAFQLNNKYLSAFVSVDSKLSVDNSITISNFTYMKIEHINCVLDKCLKTIPDVSISAIFTNCEFIGD